jgi:hypothetical protein
MNDQKFNEKIEKLRDSLLFEVFVEEKLLVPKSYWGNDLLDLYALENLSKLSVEELQSKLEEFLSLSKNLEVPCELGEFLNTEVKKINNYSLIDFRTDIENIMDSNFENLHIYSVLKMPLAELIEEARENNSNCYLVVADNYKKTLSATLFLREKGVEDCKAIKI